MKKRREESEKATRAMRLQNKKVHRSRHPNSISKEKEELNYRVEKYARRR